MKPEQIGDRARRAEGQSDRKLCAEYEISQARYYQPRRLCLANAPSRQGRLERENARLKALVGELTPELKKTRRS